MTRSKGKRKRASLAASGPKQQIESSRKKPKIGNGDYSDVKANPTPQRHAPATPGSDHGSGTPHESGKGQRGLTVECPVDLSKKEKKKWRILLTSKGSHVAAKFAAEALRKKHPDQMPRRGSVTTGDAHTSTSSRTPRRPGEPSDLLRRATATSLAMPPRKQWTEPSANERSTKNHSAPFTAPKPAQRGATASASSKQDLDAATASATDKTFKVTASKATEYHKPASTPDRVLAPGSSGPSHVVAKNSLKVESPPTHASQNHGNDKDSSSDEESDTTEKIDFSLLQSGKTAVSHASEIAPPSSVRPLTSNRAVSTNVESESHSLPDDGRLAERKTKSAHLQSEFNEESAQDTEANANWIADVAAPAKAPPPKEDYVAEKSQPASTQQYRLPSAATPSLSSFGASLRSSYGGSGAGVAFTPPVKAKPTSVPTTNVREDVRSVFDRFSAFVNGREGGDSDDEDDDSSSSASDESEAKLSQNRLVDTGDPSAIHELQLSGSTVEPDGPTERPVKYEDTSESESDEEQTPDEESRAQTFPDVKGDPEKNTARNKIQDADVEKTLSQDPSIPTQGDRKGEEVDPNEGISKDSAFGTKVVAANTESRHNVESASEESEEDSDSAVSGSQQKGSVDDRPLVQEVATLGIDQDKAESDSETEIEEAGSKRFGEQAEELAEAQLRPEGHGIDEAEAVKNDYPPIVGDAVKLSVGSPKRHANIEDESSVDGGASSDGEQLGHSDTNGKDVGISSSGSALQLEQRSEHELDSHQNDIHGTNTASAHSDDGEGDSRGSRNILYDESVSGQTEPQRTSADSSDEDASSDHSVVEEANAPSPPSTPAIAPKEDEGAGKEIGGHRNTAHPHQQASGRKPTGAVDEHPSSEHHFESCRDEKAQQQASQQLQGDLVAPDQGTADTPTSTGHTPGERYHSSGIESSSESESDDDEDDDDDEIVSPLALLSRSKSSPVAKRPVSAHLGANKSRRGAATDEGDTADSQLQRELSQQQTELNSSATAIVPDSIAASQQQARSAEVQIVPDTQHAALLGSNSFTPINPNVAVPSAQDADDHEPAASNGAKRQPSFLGGPVGSAGSGAAQPDNHEAAYLKDQMEDDDIYRTVDEVTRDVFDSTRPLPPSKRENLENDTEHGALTNSSSLSALNCKAPRQRLAKEVYIPQPSPSLKNDVFAYYSPRMPKEPQDVHFAADTGPVPEPQDSLHGAESNLDSEEGETGVLLSQEKESSSSLNELSRSPTPLKVGGADLSPPDGQQEGDHTEVVQGENEDAEEVKPTSEARRKRKMTGMTSKHFSPAKKPVRRQATQGTAAEASSELQQADLLGAVVDAAAPISEVGEPAPAPKRTRVKRKATGTRSDHFLPAELDRVDLPTPNKSPNSRTPAGVSRAPVPPITAERFGIVQEKLWDQPFWLLIAVTFLNQTAGRAAIPVFWKLKERYPTIEALAEADYDDVLSMVRHLGLQKARSARVISMAQAWRDEPPEVGKRYKTKDYPEKGDHIPYNRRQVPCIEGDAQECAGALEIARLPGCGRYAWDSWRIFCRDVLRGVAEDYNGKGARAEGFEPEWKRVLPADKELVATIRWMWLREGWIWDSATGERRLASEGEMQRAREGEMDVQHAKEASHARAAVGMESPAKKRARKRVAKKGAKVDESAVMDGPFDDAEEQVDGAVDELDATEDVAEGQGAIDVEDDPMDDLEKIAEMGDGRKRADDGEVTLEEDQQKA